MSITLTQEQEAGFVEVGLTGTLTKDDYRIFVPKIEELIQRNGKLDVLVNMRDFHGWSAGALWEDLKFDLHHFSDIHRLAMVGDKKWEAWMATFCKPFTTATVKYFDQAHSAEARAWLKSA